MTPEVKKLLEYIKKHAERESGFLTSHPSFEIEVRGLVDEIVRIFNLSEDEVANIFNE